MQSFRIYSTFVSSSAQLEERIYLNSPTAISNSRTLLTEVKAIFSPMAQQYGQKNLTVDNSRY
jgi:hypothetical protein